MNDANLEKLIAESIARVEVEEAEMKAKAEADEATYQELMQKATYKALAEVDKRDQIPDTLIPYIHPTSTPGYWDFEGGIRALREGWLPYEFKINAPGLAPIAFALKSDWDIEERKNKPPRVRSLSAANGISNWETWREAIVMAARRYADEEAWRREDERRMARMARETTAPEPTLAERFESLIREIVRDELSNREEGD